jgi:hypothetical protein
VFARLNPQRFRACAGRCPTPEHGALVGEPSWARPISPTAMSSGSPLEARARRAEVRLPSPVSRGCGHRSAQWSWKADGT